MCSPSTSCIRRSGHSEQVPSEVRNTRTRAPPCPKTSRLMSRSRAELCQRWCSTFTDSRHTEEKWKCPGEPPAPGALVVTPRPGLEPTEVGPDTVSLAQEKIAQPAGIGHVLWPFLNADVEINPGWYVGRPFDLGEDSPAGKPQRWAEGPDGTECPRVAEEGDQADEAAHRRAGDHGALPS